MAPNSLSPAYVVINYHSVYGSHKMTLPTLAFNPGTPSGSFDKHGGGTIVATDMVDDFVDLIAEFFPTTTHFDFYEVFTKADATADSVLRQSATLSQVGLVATPGWAKATEAIFSLKSTSNGIYKVALLDIASGGSFEKLTFSTLTAEAAAFVTYLVTGDHGWAARDDGAPNTFLQVSFGLNKALRRKYNLN